MLAQLPCAMRWRGVSDCHAKGRRAGGAMRPNALSFGFALARQHGIDLFSLLRSLKGGKRGLRPVEVDSVLTHQTLPLVMPGF